MRILYSLLIVSLFVTTSAFVNNNDDDCCSAPKVFENQRLVIPQHYRFDCDSGNCFKIDGYEGILCHVEFTLHSETLSLKFQYIGDSITTDSLSTALKLLMKEKAYTGSFIYITGYAINDSCFRNIGPLKVN